MSDFHNRHKIGAFLLLTDFDEQTADDWDVDMSIYYDKGIWAENPLPQETGKAGKL